MTLKSVPTKGRTLDHAAFVYDILEPVLLLGKQAEYDKHIVSLKLVDECLPGKRTRCRFILANTKRFTQWRTETIEYGR